MCNVTQTQCNIGKSSQRSATLIIWYFVRRWNAHTEKQQEFNFITHIRQIICSHREHTASEYCSFRGAMLCVISKVEYIEHFYTESISRLIIYTVNLTSGMRLCVFLCVDSQKWESKCESVWANGAQRISNKQTITVSVVDRGIFHSNTH